MRADIEVPCLNFTAIFANAIAKVLVLHPDAAVLPTWRRRSGFPSPAYMCVVVYRMLQFLRGANAAQNPFKQFVHLFPRIPWDSELAISLNMTARVNDCG